MSLAQFGEFGFVILVLAEDHALISSGEVRLVVTAGVVSMVASRVAMGLAPRLRAGEAALRPLERLMRTRSIDEAAPAVRSMHGHVVLAGFGVAGRLLSHALGEARVPRIVLELSAERVRSAHASGAPVYYGDVSSLETLSYAGIERSRVLVLLINDPDAMRRAVAVARRLAPDVFIVVRSRYVADRAALLRLGADLVVHEELESGLEVATRVLDHLGAEHADVRTFVDDVLRSARGDMGRGIESILAEAEEREARAGDGPRDTDAGPPPAA